MYLVVLYIILIIVVIYIISLLIYITGNLIYNTHRKSEQLPSISVIISVKNGEQSLPTLLNELENQTYRGMVEYVIVDDESIDNTKEIIKQFQKKNNKFKYMPSKEGNQKLFLKKRALDAGIKNSKFDILLFTDVDCRLKSSWVKSMAECFIKDVSLSYNFFKLDS